MAGKLVAVSGYFDPLHIGHLEYIKMAKDLAGEDGKLVVVLNNDNQAYDKNKKIFMCQEDRRKILEAIKWVDEVYISIDEDDTICKSLIALQPDIFAKGGGWTEVTIPERELCNDLKIKTIFKVGNNGKRKPRIKK